MQQSNTTATLYAQLSQLPEGLVSLHTNATAVRDKCVVAGVLSGYYRIRFVFLFSFFLNNWVQLQVKNITFILIQHPHMYPVFSLLPANQKSSEQNKL